ncbi:hypothetical protein QYE76_008072 [Lolium multiflorum]|uniref:Dirigent protein n=1 Tax=Lolium multiflorum TaxID=4521 RepID=A0AAD8PHF7_LOLMU|nr:hypothetical protein QYE76_008072 [Lolium multiflorum]
MYLIANGEGHPGANEKGVIPPLATALLNPEMFFTLIMFGRAIAGDYEIRDGPDPATSSIVARGRSFSMGDSMTSHGYFTAFDILFTDERFKGSTLKVMGSFENVDEDGADHLAIIGGTREFAYAQGTIGYKAIKLTAPQIIRELNIRVFCRNVPPPAPVVNKEGPLGGKGGTAFDIPAEALPPQRIDSITIRSDGAINSFAYSYTDKAGNKQTSGPWGGTGGNLQKTVSSYFFRNICICSRYC